MASRFQDNAAAFTEAFGVQQAPLVIYLSMIPWEADDREQFIRTVAGKKSGRASTEQSRVEILST